MPNQIERVNKEQYLIQLEIGYVEPRRIKFRQRKFAIFLPSYIGAALPALHCSRVSPGAKLVTGHSRRPTHSETAKGSSGLPSAPGSDARSLSLSSRIAIAQCPASSRPRSSSSSAAVKSP